MVADRLEFYYRTCTTLSVPPDPAVIATLKTNSTHLEVSKCVDGVAEGRWLALVELLVSRYEQAAQHMHMTYFHGVVRRRSVEPAERVGDGTAGRPAMAITHLDLSGYGRAVGANHGVLLRTLLTTDQHLEELHVRSCGIVKATVKSICEGLTGNMTLRVLDLENNNIERDGAGTLAACITTLPPTAALACVDITNTFATFEGVTDLTNAVAALNQARAEHNAEVAEAAAAAAAAAAAEETADDAAARDVSPLVSELSRLTHLAASMAPSLGAAANPEDLPPLQLLCDRNFAKEEVANAVSHGLAVLLCIVYACLLLPKAQRLPDEGKYLGCLVFIVSMMTCYISSTLYHGMFMHKGLQKIFRILDHSAIFLLIAGTYTPICLLKLGDEPYTWLLLMFQWSVAFCGVSIKAFSGGLEEASKLEVFLFMLMGWSALSVAPQLWAMEEYCRNRLVLGGLAYTFGIIFFIKGDTWPMYHAVWHIFVIVGGLFHFLSIYEAVKQDLAVLGNATMAGGATGYPHLP